MFTLRAVSHYSVKVAINALLLTLVALIRRMQHVWCAYHVILPTPPCTQPNREQSCVILLYYTL